MNLMPDFIKRNDPCAHGQLVLSMIFMFTFLAFPFIEVNVLIIIFLVMLIAFRYLEINPHLLKSLDTMLRTRSTQAFVASILILFLVSFVLDSFAYNYPIFVIGQVVAISTIGLGSATLVRCHKESTYMKGKSPERGLKNDEMRINFIHSSITMLIVGIIFASLAGFWIVYWQGANISYNMIFFVAVIGSITAGLFESIPSKIDKNISIPLGSGMAMWLFFSFGYSIPTNQILFALLFSMFLGYLAYYAKIADISASLSATLIGVQ